MSKKRKNKQNKKPSRTSTKAVKPPAKKSKLLRRKTLTTLALGAFLVGVSGLGLSSYMENWEKDRDLSVIGNGKITVVQIHDSSCSMCRKLQSNTQSALKGMDENIQYRIADINTNRGRSFQIKHNKPHVTLLIFNRSGELTRSLEGVRSIEELRKVFERLNKYVKNS